MAEMSAAHCFQVSLGKIPLSFFFFFFKLFKIPFAIFNVPESLRKIFLRLYFSSLSTWDCGEFSKLQIGQLLRDINITVAYSAKEVRESCLLEKQDISRGGKDDSFFYHLTFHSLQNSNGWEYLIISG